MSGDGMHSDVVEEWNCRPSTLYNLDRNYARSTGRPVEPKSTGMATCGHVKALLNLGLRNPIIGRPNVVVF